MAGGASPVLFRLVLGPLRRFLRTEALGGVVLFASALVALAWANSPWAGSYRWLLAQEIAVGLGPLEARFGLRSLVGDGLMTLFFFVVGMEIKRELVLGELSSLRKAVLPAVAALGGMVLPSLIYLALNPRGDAARGWAIPMATDIAFCVGCLTLLKGRVTGALVVFLTALAIFDDMGGILVIALFYGHGLQGIWLAVSGMLLLALVAAGRLQLRSGWAYAAGGAALWFVVHHAGVHATIAGVLLGLCIPAAARNPAEVWAGLGEKLGDLVGKRPEAALLGEELAGLESRLRELESPLERFIHRLHPWVAFFIMPVFALANSGVDLSGLSPRGLVSPVVLGSALGLFVGKQVGVFLPTLLAVRLGLAPMPGGAPRVQLLGVSMLAGIGFTVALFIAGLAFAEAPELLEQAKLGILLGSLAAGLSGFALLRFSRSPPVTA